MGELYSIIFGMPTFSNVLFEKYFSNIFEGYNIFDNFKYYYIYNTSNLNFSLCANGLFLNSGKIIAVYFIFRIQMLFSYIFCFLMQI